MNTLIVILLLCVSGFLACGCAATRSTSPATSKHRGDGSPGNLVSRSLEAAGLADICAAADDRSRVITAHMDYGWTLTVRLTERVVVDSSNIQVRYWLLKMPKTDAEPLAVLETKTRVFAQPNESAAEMLKLVHRLIAAVEPYTGWPSDGGSAVIYCDKASHRLVIKQYDPFAAEIVGSVFDTYTYLLDGRNGEDGALIWEYDLDSTRTFVSEVVTDQSFFADFTLGLFDLLFPLEFDPDEWVDTQ